MSPGDVAEVLVRTAPAAANGDVARYKTTNAHDSTAEHPGLLGIGR